MLAKQISGAAAAVQPAYIEDVFSTYLYTGNGSTQTITNGIDLAGKGGLVWIKSRSAAENHFLFDTARGANAELNSNTTEASTTLANSLTAFNGNGFSIGNAATAVNTNATTYVSWAFREQAKFFDVVTYTGNETAGKTVNHSLGSDPGCIIIKRISPSGYNWFVYHRSNPTKYTNLNLTNAETNFTIVTSVSSTNFTLPADASTNANGIDYVAYLFAHNAGGFGLSGAENVISCGSFTQSGGTATVNLGYEPQWILLKANSAGENWYIVDNMRGMAVSGNQARLSPNDNTAEDNNISILTPTATGFVTNANLGGSLTYIYIAIRRGPMKVPTSGTSVYYGETYTGNATARSFTAPGFPPDLFVSGSRSAVADGSIWGDRLRGVNRTLYSAYTQAESTLANVITNFGQNGASIGTDSSINGNTNTYVGWNFRRAPGFFDEVCYTGNNVYQQSQTHNLGVAPELIIVKQRNSSRNWAVGCNFTNNQFQYLNLNSGADGGNTNAYTTGGFFGGNPTATTFILAQNPTTNESGGTYVAYLFATLAGVSKVGTYTGTGAAQTINCGFTGGARFVLIKRLGDNVDPGVGGWYVWDSARGIVAGNDPYLLLNSNAAEVTNTDYIDTYSAGFEISSTAPAAINANGGTYIFLAIA